MFYEMRTYRLKVGAMPAYLSLVANEGIALQKKYLGELVAYFTTDIGPAVAAAGCCTWPPPRCAASP